MHHHSTLQSHWFGQGRNDHKFLWSADQPRQRPTSSDLAYLGSVGEGKQWIIGGEFNMILTLEKNRGGKNFLEEDSGKLQELIENLRLVDIENINGTYTWTDKRSRNHQIACRLDCFLITETLLLEGPIVESNILSREGSNH
jgi:hypothetical protein